MRLLAIALAALVTAGCSVVGVGGSTGPNEWWLIGTTPGAEELLIATQFGGVASGCSRWEGWRVEEASEQIRVEALVWRKHAPGGCTDDAAGRTIVVELGEPLGSRELLGCQREECGVGQTWPNWLDDPAPPVKRAGGTVVVAGQQITGFSGDGAITWIREDLPANRLYGGDDLAVVSDGGVSTVALDPASGDTLWQQDGGPEGMTADLVLVCVGDDADAMQAIDKHSGSARWRADVPCHVAGIRPEVAVVLGGDPEVDGGHRIVVLDPRTGEVMLDQPVDDGVDDQVGAYQDALLVEDRILLGGTQGDLLMLDLSGNELLRRPQVRGAPVGAIGNIVIVADHQGTTAVDLVDGDELWTRDALVAAELVVAEDALLGLDGPGGQLERIDPRAGDTRWTADIGMTTGFDAAMVDGTIHLTTSLAHIRVAPSSGDLETWTPLPRDEPADNAG